ncbi:carboxylesterase 1-like [Prosopis cineraria]|uniref:carboxylesterase 1-like n=1 Tax=Prosopis cineraria TaxID=364024 RepID=UPI00240FA3D4|nr:carboxylesterase 1-like [Prosopis cineraria]
MSLLSFSPPRFFSIAAVAFSLYYLSVAFSTTIVAGPPPTTMDPYQLLHIIRNPNGTLTRLEKHPESPAAPDPNPHLPVLSKDLTINPSRDTWARIFLPLRALNHSRSSLTKLPLIVFFHGGGFIFYAANSTYFHDFCVSLVQNTQSVIVSVNYRLAPEHRLPAAYDDALEALHWIQTSEDRWLTRFADYSRCYLIGGSAGGNIACNAGLRAAAEVDQLEPVKIQGLILIQPFFGGVRRTPSEQRLANDTILPLLATDLMWELSLPVGADRDHEYSNPTAERGSKGFDNITRLGWKVIVFGSYGDPLVDRQIKLVNPLQENGAQVESHFQGEDKHGAFVGQPTQGKALELYDTLKKLFNTPLVA